MNVEGTPQTVNLPITLDVAFAVTGTTLPVDHGYPLFGALCQHLGDLHGAEWLAVHPMRGATLGGDRIGLQRGGLLTLRIEHSHLPLVLPLVGKTLQIQGSKVHIGAPQLRMLQPFHALSSRMVVYKHHLTEETFLPHIIQDLNGKGITANVDLKRRRITTVAGDKVVGFGVFLSNLTPESSVQLQTTGLGGRRHFGCGVFVPTKPRGAHGQNG